MKRYLLLLLISLYCNAKAQKGQPAIGKIDKADLEMKDCDFDKGAVAMKLIDYGNVFYRRGKVDVTLFNTVYEQRVRIKILKEAGLKYADVSIPYFDQDNEEQIQKITAYTYNLDAGGNIKATEVGKSSIYSKRINKQHSEMIIAFPEAKVGSVIEYKYTMERQTMQHLKDWYFQERIPTRFSEYQLNIPSVFRFILQPSVVDPIDAKEEVTEENIAINDNVVTAEILHKTYIMHNLKGIHDEPFMGSSNDYLQRLEFQLSQIDFGEGRIYELIKKWSDVVTELMKKEDFGMQLEKKIPESEAIISQAATIPEQEGKFRLIFNYVRKNMTWDNRESIFSYDGVVKAWKDRNGSSADINLMLVNLLRQAGVRADPILFSTRENGLLNNAYPLVSQFNTVMAYAQLNGNYYVLDATDKYSSYKLTPESIVNTKGFVVTGEKGKWIDVTDDSHKYKVITAVHGDIDSSGMMHGNGLVNCEDYARKQRCASWTRDKEKFREGYFSKAGSPVKIEDLAVNNMETDSLPLEQKVSFSYPLNSSGDYRYFTVNLFSDLENNPFLSDERMSDVDFGFLQEYMLFGSYTIPDGYAFELLPENISMVMPDNSIVFNRFLQAEDNLLNVRITVTFKRTYYLAAHYPDFAAFYKKMMAKLNEQIVIKKKQAK